MFNVNDLTIGQVKEIQQLISGNKEVNQDCPFEIGEMYLIRTVTFTLTGKIKSKTNQFIVLEQADWIADTGRFSESLENQDKFNEVEPFKNDAIVAKGAIVDATKITKLIRKMK